MSWSARYKIDGKTGERFDDWESNVSTEQHADQYKRAQRAVQDIMDSGVVGDPTKETFAVNISGHGNPNHERTPGWGNDFIQIQIAQL
jgi:hypothetical protein